MDELKLYIHGALVEATFGPVMMSVLKRENGTE
jgi:hypothetical protein